VIYGFESRRRRFTSLTDRSGNADTASFSAAESRLLWDSENRLPNGNEMDNLEVGQRTQGSNNPWREHLNQRLHRMRRSRGGEL